MAALPLKRYRFSVPITDESSQAWMAAQQNANISIRMLIQAAQAQFGTTDVISQCSMPLTLPQVNQKEIVKEKPKVIAPKPQQASMSEAASDALQSMLQ